MCMTVSSHTLCSLCEGQLPTALFLGGGGIGVGIGEKT